MTSRQRAQALVEFALTLPVLLLLILGVVDAGRGVVAATSLSNGAREGARYGAIHWRDSLTDPNAWQANVETLIRNETLGLDSSHIVFNTVSVDQAAGVVRVQLSYSFQAAAPLVNSIMGSVTLAANASMATQ